MEHAYDPEVRKFNFSVKPIAKEDTQAGGLILKGFYSENRVLDRAAVGPVGCSSFRTVLCGDGYGAGSV